LDSLLGQVQPRAQVAALLEGPGQLIVQAFVLSLVRATRKPHRKKEESAERWRMEVGREGTHEKGPNEHEDLKGHQQSTERGNGAKDGWECPRKVHMPAVPRKHAWSGSPMRAYPRAVAVTVTGVAVPAREQLFVGWPAWMQAVPASSPQGERGERSLRAPLQ